MSVWKAVWDKDWGMRGPRTYVTKYFSKRPTVDQVISAFKEEAPRMSHRWFRPECSGMVVISKIKLEF